MENTNTISTSSITISSDSVSGTCDNYTTPYITGPDSTTISTTGTGVSDITYPYWRYWDYELRRWIEYPDYYPTYIEIHNHEKVECPLNCKKEKNAKKKEKRYLPEIKKVIFNPPATVVIWKDGSKTIVKCEDGTDFDRWTGLSMAIAKKALGDDYHKIFKKHCLKLIDSVDVREVEDEK